MSSDGKILASAGLDQYIVLWNLENGEMIRPIYGFVNKVNAIDFSADGALMYIGYKDGTIRRWNLSTHEITTNRIEVNKGRTSGRIYRWNFSIENIERTAEENQIKLFCRKIKEVKEKVNQKFVPVQWITAAFSKGKDVSLRATPYEAIWNLDGNSYELEKLEKGRFLNNDQTNVVSDEIATFKAWIDAGNNLIVEENGNQLFKVATRHSAPVSTIKFNPVHPYLVTGSWDGIIKMWDRQTGELKLSLMTIGKEDFLYLSPENYYYVSKNALDGVGLRDQEKIYSLAQFDLLYNRPDLVLKQLPYATDSLIYSYQHAYEKRLEKMGFEAKNLSSTLTNIPEIDILNRNKLPIIVKERQLSFSLRASDASNKLNRINVYVNGVPANGRKGINLKAESSQAVEKNVSIELSKGLNRIQVSVLNESGIQSVEEVFEVTYQPEEDLPNDLYVIAIGVSQYTDQSKNLVYASKDAKDIINTFDKIKNRYQDYHPLLITDEAFTIETLDQVKELLDKAQVDDEVILFYAGHGVLDDRLDFYLSTSDIDFLNPKERGLPYDYLEELLDATSSRKKMLLMDACHSGEVDKEDIQFKVFEKGKVNLRTIPTKEGETKIGLQNSFDLMKELYADLRRETGAHILSSAKGGEFAFESNKWNNGAFTYCLIRGLAELAADRNGDKEILLSELQAYLSVAVAELTENNQQPTIRNENIFNDYRIW